MNRPLRTLLAAPPPAPHWRTALCDDLDAVLTKAALEAKARREVIDLLHPDVARRVLRLAAALTPHGQETAQFLGLAQIYDQLRPGWRAPGVK
jgi:hypothetical protein